MTEIVSILTGSVGAIVLSALIRTMPEPEHFANNVWYTWFYDFAQLVLANTDKSGLVNRTRNASCK
jgi:hypothetical protein